MYFAEENERLRKIVRRIAEGSPGRITSRPIDALLYSIVRASRPERCLELGAYEGTTSLYIAQGLKDNEEGSLLSVEIDEGYARGARQHLEEAGLGDYAEVRVGDSLEVVPDLEGMFDLVFIDTAPDQYPDDYRNVRPLLSERGVLGIDDALVSSEVVGLVRRDMNVLEFQEYRSFLLAQPRQTEK